ncbi:MAG: F0F1 ATP synthase subunit gamma [Acidimicrobiia bacterium]|jgi:F-type H+-transporting ATPase subunit gamma
MPTVEQLSRKLQVGEELHSVVGTMKGLAAVAIHEYERAVGALREYTATIEQGLQVLFFDRPESVPAEMPGEGRVAVIVVGTDQGLCGPINREIARAAREWCEEHDVESGHRLVVALGARAARELESMGLTPNEHVALPGSVEVIARVVDDLILHIDRWRTEEDVDRVVVFFQHPLQRTQRTTRMFQVIPPDVHRLRSIAERPWPTRMLPASPHERGVLLAGLLREDLFIALYRAVAEAKTAEHGARLSAMQAAEQNIEERITTLRNQYHQLRQAQITEELLDVVSGFEALEQR